MKRKNTKLVASKYDRTLLELRDVYQYELGDLEQRKCLHFEKKKV